jgi:hypothetical protein
LDIVIALGTFAGNVVSRGRSAGETCLRRGGQDEQMGGYRHGRT